MAVADTLLLAAEQVDGVLGRPDQDQLLPARELQALSLAVHIPLVCFGIAFPAMVLFTEGLWLRTGDPVYKALAKRWSKVMLVLFAIGVVTGTILSFEFGLLWPNFMATFGEVFGVGFTLEGVSFFVEAIFIAIYVYGWDRLPKRTHFLTGIPVAIAGVTGSLLVIAVNGWMNDPGGYDVVNGQVENVRPFEALFGGNVWHELVHMYLAGYLVVGFLLAGYYGRRWLAGRRDRYTRTALVIGLTFAALAAPVQVLVGDWAARTVAGQAAGQAGGVRGARGDDQGRAVPPGRLTGADRSQGGATQAAVAAGLPRPQRHRQGAGHRARGRPAAGEHRARLVPDDGHDRHRADGAGRCGTWLLWWRRRSLPESKWFYRALSAAGPLAIVALICGWITTEVGRQPWVVYEVMRTEQAVTDARRHVDRLRDHVRGLRRPDRARRGGCCGGCARRPRWTRWRHDAGRRLPGDRDGRPGRLRRAGGRRLRRRACGT